MDRFNTKYFLNFLDKHIEKIGNVALKIANAKIFNFKIFQSAFYLSETQAFSILIQLSEINAIEWKVISNTIMIDVKDKNKFVNFICLNRKYETQIMYLRLCGKISVQKIADVFQISNLSAQILYSKILANSNCFNISLNESLLIKDLNFSLLSVPNFANKIIA